MVLLKTCGGGMESIRKKGSKWYSAETLQDYVEVKDLQKEGSMSEGVRIKL